ncbi:MAG: ABC transporter permease [Candidatus Hadarchaeum sp.]|uniref:ABC transporter permease n=1 Tax=Candidatus Hadarchaeum sp. TaxID=2883567 RepID=UPI003D09714F
MNFVDLVGVTLRQAAPLMFAAYGGLFSYHVGIINIALEAEMLAGAFAALVVTAWTGNVELGLLGAMFAAGLLGLIFSLLIENLQANLVTTALGLNTLTIAFARLLMWVATGSRGAFVPQELATLPSLRIPLLSSVPVLQAFSGHSILVYGAWLAWAFTSLLLYHTPLGLRIRAVGENPEAARAVGLKIKSVRIMAQLLCAVLCGVGGAQLSLGDLRLFTSGMTAGKGFIALAAIYFGRGNPAFTTIACVLFGFFDGLQSRLQLWTEIPPQLAQMIPFLSVVVTLVLVSWREAHRRVRA